jgi:hypothetical protein
MASLEQQITEVIKQQVENFVRELGGFYPFATAIDKDHKIVPIGVYINDAYSAPSSQDIIDQLGRSIKEGVNNGMYVMAGIAIDVTFKDDQGKPFDALQIDFFSQNDAYSKYHKYAVIKSEVLFL